MLARKPALCDDADAGAGAKSRAESGCGAEKQGWSTKEGACSDAGARGIGAGRTKRRGAKCGADAMASSEGEVEVEGFKRDGDVEGCSEATDGAEATHDAGDESVGRWARTGQREDGETRPSRG